jgi:hypothetical protein
VFFLSSLPNLLDGCHADLDHGGLGGRGRRPTRPSSLLSPTNDDGGLDGGFQSSKHGRLPPLPHQRLPPPPL